MGRARGADARIPVPRQLLPALASRTQIVGSLLASLPFRVADSNAMRLLAITLILLTSAFSQQPAAKPPGCSAAEYRQFDFWVGKWKVSLPNGKEAGTNDITNEQDGCLLVEHWNGRGGSTGTSFNYYDLHDKKWHQLYISNAGDARAFPPM